MTNKVIYPGTFDPITNGHLDVLQRAAGIFDNLIIAVARDNAKESLFTVEERVELIRNAAAEIGKTAKRLNEKDGPIDRLAEGTQALSSAADAFNAATLPRINQVTDETSRAVRRLSRAANSINDNPQSLIFGNGAQAPGPGEPGFSAPQGGNR